MKKKKQKLVVSKVLKRKGLSPITLAKKLGITYPALHSRTINPVYSNLHEIANVANINIHEFIEAGEGYIHIYDEAGEWLGIQKTTE